MSRRFGATAILFFLLCFISHPPLGTTLSVGYTPEKTCFSVQYRGEKSSYRVTPLFVLPGEKVVLEIGDVGANETFAMTGAGGAWSPDSRLTWTWTAPRKTGLYPATVTENSSGESMGLQIFVMVPYGKVKSETLNGYHIGRYPKVPPEKSALYGLPRGFIEVTPENKNTLIAPHFKLNQFLCKQRGAYPKYVVLRERLVLKLEYLLEHVNAEGIPARTFSVMSGYRTPYYNRSLNNVRMSRHMWGDAADIFITNDPGDNYMADLNGDGKRDYRDAQILYQMVNELQDKPSFKEFVGGLGWYKPTESHGPFVHIDARGKKAKWHS